MADDFNDRYKKAASLRLLSLMMPGATPGQSQPKPGAPNYSAIPLNPPPPSLAPPDLEPYKITVFNGPQSLTNVPWWVPPGEPLTNGDKDQPPMPPAMNLGPMPPMNADAQQADDAARYRPQPIPAQQPMPVAPPVTVQAPPMDPRTMGDADMAGYGGSPRIPGIAPPQPYSHLNPTPSLEEIFRREYAANPMAFGGKFG